MGAGYPADEMLQPVLVCGTGRSGTTLTMQLLATSPRIAMHREYVYEHHYFRYLLEWAALPFRDSWCKERWGVGALMFPATGSLEEGLLGPLPWHPRDLIDSGEAMSQRWFRAAWLEFSRVAARRTPASPGKPATYYAEKCDRPWTLSGLGWLPVRKIALVRDPRDIWLSVLAFDARRGYHGFGRYEEEPEDSYLDRFLEEQREHLTWASTVRSDDDALLLRYEAMVTDLDGMAKQLGSWLGVELDAPTVGSSTGAFDHHMTAPSARASVERWRSELPDSRRALFARRLGAELRAHGYDP